MNREKIDKKYKWDLSKIYGSIEEFNKDYDLVVNNSKKIREYNGIKLDSKSLYSMLELSMNTSRVLEKLYAYANLLSDMDTSNTDSMALRERVMNLYHVYSRSSYFVDTKILRLKKGELNSFYRENPKLLEYKIMIDKLYRYKKHLLSDKEEKLLSEFGRMLGNNYDTYELFKDCDMNFPSFSVNDKEYKLDNSTYSLYMESDNREVRETAFKNLYSMYKQYKNVYASLISSNIKENCTIAKVKRYSSSIEASLYRDELDIKIYDNLIDSVHRNMSFIHKYYKMKKEILGVKELHLYDVYAPLTKESSKKYEYEDAKKIVIDVLSIFGSDYVNTLKFGIENWIDVYPSPAKRTGGYSGGAYDTYPYILLNYQDKYNDMSTLIHELGHSMHSYYARKSNPYQYGDYAIFVAEVASTVNELLLAKYMLANSKNKQEKLAIFDKLMELYRATIYRQTMFAEFERDIYNNIENDLPLTSDILCEKYYKLNKEYFGNDVIIDEEIKYEWERIPHFYYDFYVYKYSIGLSVATYIVNGLLNGSIKNTDYIKFLSCGRTLNPVDSLKLTKVNVMDKEVVDSALIEFNGIVDEFYKLYKE